MSKGILNHDHLSVSALTALLSPDSSVWHHEESKILLSKRNGDLEWKSFQRNLTFTVGRLSAEQLLKHLIAKQLEFDSLKNIRCLAFQRDFCILQTSTRQVVALQWKSNLTTNIVWGLKVDEFAAWTFCDKLFVVFEPHTKNLRKFSVPPRTGGGLPPSERIRLSPICSFDC